MGVKKNITDGLIKEAF